MTRIEKEQRIVTEMIAIYCHHKHKAAAKDGNHQLCPACQQLNHYARARLSHCPFGEKKTSCYHCTVHCYSPERRKEIAQVMRHSGPWMLLYHPFLTIYHMTQLRKKPRINKA